MRERKRERKRERGEFGRTGPDQLARVDPPMPLEVLVPPPASFGRPCNRRPPHSRDRKRSQETRTERIVRVAAEVVSYVFGAEGVELELPDRSRPAEVVTIGEERRSPVRAGRGGLSRQRDEEARSRRQAGGLRRHTWITRVSTNRFDSRDDLPLT